MKMMKFPNLWNPEIWESVTGLGHPFQGLKALDSANLANQEATAAPP